MVCSGQTTQPLCNRDLTSHLGIVQTGCSVINPSGEFLQVVLHILQPWSRDSEGFERVELFQTQQTRGLQAELKGSDLRLFKLHHFLSKK